MDTGVRGDLAVSVEDFLAPAALAGRWAGFKQGAALAPAAAEFLRGVYDDASVDELGDLGVDETPAPARADRVNALQFQCLFQPNYWGPLTPAAPNPRRTTA